MASFKRKKKSKVHPDMNVTPLVDVVLVLLIIFMVLAPVVNAHYVARLPPPDTEDEAIAEANPDNQPLVLKVSEREGEDGEVEAVFMLGSEELVQDEADPEKTPAYRLGRLVAGRDDKVVYVDATDDTNYGYVLQAMSFATDAEEVVNRLAKEKVKEQGKDPSQLATLRVSAVLVTKEIPTD